MNITLNDAADTLLRHDNFLIITHANPDGDTLGSGFGLCFALRQLGKKANVICSDEFPKRFMFLYNGYSEEVFKPEFIVSVDVATPELMGKLKETLPQVDLCIDHHKTNAYFAKNSFVLGSAATCEHIYSLLLLMNVNMTKQIASCLYTGIATDTGCFKFSNTTASTHQIASELISMGADYPFINEYLFDTKSKSRISVEQEFLNRIEYYLNGRLAVSYITRKMINDTGADEAELDGVSGITRSIEGVDIGITLREKEDGSCKVSVRTTAAFDASNICAQFGGGGHARAAGCRFSCGIEQAKQKIVSFCETLI